jgi:DNA helicase-2/ATP-dependent DNA helicase PcrA
MIRTVSVTATYLETLNPEQRRAVEHGVRAQDCAPGRPLLVIAGAGSGKTNTLAHRVAHLIVNGAGPRRILLMTFSRRAAAEMTRRVERIAPGDGRRADIMTDAGWAGTFHGIGAARLCRPDRARSNYIHDRDEPGPAQPRLLEKTEGGFRQGDLSRHLFARCEFGGAPR